MAHSDNQLTAEELAAIRERESKATPGPWVSGYYVFGGLVRKGQDQCNWCGKNAPLVSTYEAQPNEAQAAKFDSTAHQHLFPRDDEDAWREILSLTTYTSISGNYDSEAGGICSTKDDAAFIAAARTDIPRLLATVEAALLSIEDQAAIIADRDATVEALRAENERLRAALREFRTAFDDYQGSEGCECCESSDHTIHAKTMARLMKEPEA